MSDFISPNDLINVFPSSRVSICVHDAGSAALIASWVSSGFADSQLCAEGPALRIFDEKFGRSSFSRVGLYDAIRRSDILISGTGWSSNLEHQSRLLARQMGVPSIAVLDHWCNYEERFVRDGNEILPDLIWVSDFEAATIARETFPSIPVSRLPNHWIEDIRRSVDNIRLTTDLQRSSSPRMPAARLLYLLEPIRLSWNTGSPVESEEGEFQALRYWLTNLPNLIEAGWVASPDELEAIVLRLHPSEPVNKYDDFIAGALDRWPISLDTSPSLPHSLAWADAAFGCETQALVAAMACDLPAFSTIPPWAPPCRLPQASLHHLNRLVSG